jgi:beta-glucanase (GH16 family)
MTNKPTHNLNFQSGMLQSWNKLCFQGGYIEFSLIQPGGPTTSGYWPAAWLMGNLGRPGYLGTTDGMWPYSYQGCDTGILPGQTNAQGGPVQAVDSSATFAAKGKLSKLPGMRTPSCTCPGQDHPGPNVGVGRSAPEIDIVEAQIQYRNGEQHSWASQSMQVAPFDDAYYWVNDTPAVTLLGDNTHINNYVGGPYQESVSGVSLIPDRGFQDNAAPDAEKYTTFALEYLPDWDNTGNGFVTWYVDGIATYTATGAAIPASKVMEISRRNVPTEPMAIIMNLGMSRGFQQVDFGNGGVEFPATMKFDYVRVYQEAGQERLSCDPADHPTAEYIKNHIDVYSNANITTWNSTSYKWPTNSLRTGC